MLTSTPQSADRDWYTGTLSAKLIENYANIRSVVTGDLLRQEMAKGSEIGQRAATVMRQGGLLPDSVIARMLEPYIRNHACSSWLLDGYPRTIGQAQLLDDLLGNLGSPLNLYVNEEHHREVSF